MRKTKITLTEAEEQVFNAMCELEIDEKAILLHIMNTIEEENLEIEVEETEFFDEEFEEEITEDSEIEADITEPVENEQIEAI